MKYFFANWKAYLTPEEAVTMAKSIALSPANDNVVAAVFPDFVSLLPVAEVLSGSTIAVGAQNVSGTAQGAYTGAITASELRSANIPYVLVGHSESRYVFGEGDETVRKKLVSALTENISPILCVGETKEDMDAGKRQYRIRKQLQTALKDVQWNGTKILVAYEPVWAVGTREPCAPADADDVIGWIKEELKQYVKEAVPVLYGGSVDDKNVVSYLSRATIDGVLVGSASATRDGWLAMADAISTV